MTFSYSVDQINSGAAKSPIYQVRLLIGDTLSTDPQMQDEEIAYHLTSRATVYGAAAECCRTLATKFGRSVDIGAGDTKINYSQLAKAYSTKVAEFESMAASGGAGAPYAGGISIRDKENQESNTDRVPPNFGIGMMDSSTPVPSTGIENEDDTSQSGLGPGP